MKKGWNAWPFSPAMQGFRSCAADYLAYRGRYDHGNFLQC
ncbi:hypothetical protein PAMC26577_00590 [Caballeronia sordidicola]|uniref:Uncharacterized protein n=1 Tax=Caballeronia sordidicola TaxID=196367 RepID=A0A242N6X4_CABSO|nr:hypothetical protein PAMC26577_00590 [Caballeronia sordidicola]